MLAVGQRPRLLARFAGAEPPGQLLPPRREVARLRQPPAVARHVEEAIELGRVDQHGLRQREQSLERLVGERQPPIAVELRDADRQLVEHRALRLAERAELARQLFHRLDVDSVAGDPFATERQVADPQRAPLRADGRLHVALDRQVLVARLLGDLRRGQPVDRLDQLDLALDRVVGARRADRLDIGAVDQPQFHVGAAEPHRRGRRFDQPDERGEVVLRRRGLRAQPGELALALGEIEPPHQRRTARPHHRIGQVAAQLQATARAARVDHHVERRRGLLRLAYRVAQLLDVVCRESRSAAVELAQVSGQLVEP